MCPLSSRLYQHSQLKVKFNKLIHIGHCAGQLSGIDPLLGNGSRKVLRGNAKHITRKAVRKGLTLLQIMAFFKFFIYSTSCSFKFPLYVEYVVQVASCFCLMLND